MREEILINGLEVKGENFVEELFRVIIETFQITDDSSQPDGENHVEDIYKRINDSPEKEFFFDIALTNVHSSSSVDFFELLLRFILIAVSRTYASGDAFFVIEDLFGGEGLCLCGGAGPSVTRKGRVQKKTRVKVSRDHVLVELFQIYDLYMADSIGSDENMIAPLVSFEAKVFTLITLRSTEGRSRNNPQLSELFLLLSASPEKICHRLLTITPFLY